MKNAKMLISRMFCIVLVSFLIASCAKDGDPGPQGEQGQEGEQGLQGEQGPQGEPGSANVIYSEWFNSGFEEEIETTVSFFVKIAPSIDEDIFNHGVVLVYGKVGFGLGKPTIYSLPHINTSNDIQYDFFVQEGLVEIIVRSLDGTSVGNANYFSQYRYVIIPGGTEEEEKLEDGKARKSFASLSYEEVAERYNIPD